MGLAGPGQGVGVGEGRAGGKAASPRPRPGPTKPGDPPRYRLHGDGKQASSFALPAPPRTQSLVETREMEPWALRGPSPRTPPCAAPERMAARTRCPRHPLPACVSHSPKASSCPTLHTRPWFLLRAAIRSAPTRPLQPLPTFLPLALAQPSVPCTTRCCLPGWPHGIWNCWHVQSNTQFRVEPWSCSGLGTEQSCSEGLSNVSGALCPRARSSQD
ncbi:uncharacterized protein LOC129048447 [Pongo abelii]|uniref:uncharacterized protein LOC129048447 n=1 Tax=Pongo abelii TaxID=9601 RepID=UPI0023E8C894|nr:uncharacterized protein LOC129048447 [Pongo abelii]